MFSIKEGSLNPEIHLTELAIQINGDEVFATEARGWSPPGKAKTKLVLVTKKGASYARQKRELNE